MVDALPGCDSALISAIVGAMGGLIVGMLFSFQKSRRQ